MYCHPIVPFDVVSGVPGRVGWELIYRSPFIPMWARSRRRILQVAYILGYLNRTSPTINITIIRRSCLWRLQAPVQLKSRKQHIHRTPISARHVFIVRIVYWLSNSGCKSSETSLRWINYLVFNNFKPLSTSYPRWSADYFHYLCYANIKL